MTLSKTYPPQGTSQNKQRLQEFLEEQNIPLESVTVEYMPHFRQLLGEVDYNNPKSVSFEELPDDIERCVVLVDGERWNVEIGSTELTGRQADH